MSHDDNVRKLGKQFANAPYAVFGPMIMGLAIQGFRGVEDLTLAFTSPVTAISGLNGTGKSTIAQLAATGFRQPEDYPRNRYYLPDFFPVSAADPEAFTAEAQIHYTYAAATGSDPQQLTVKRVGDRWRGYHRQPCRATRYLGFAHFIPKIERRDLSIYSAQYLELGEEVPFGDAAAEHAKRILALPYSHLAFTDVHTASKTVSLAMADRGGRRYSENHMGFGEGRVLYMVNTLETAPDKSLIVLEEPETSLHGDAQVRLAQYLVDVALRRRHQIIITTHSAAILGQLGRESVVYLRRTPAGEVTATHGLSTYQIDSYLQREGRAPGGITICVEDAFAQALAAEILRAVDPDLLEGCSFLHIGGGQEIPNAVKLLRKANLRAVGLSDGDMKHDGKNGVMTLPGSGPPEKEVFTHPAVKEYFAAAPFRLALDEVLAAADDHHAFASEIAQCLVKDEAAVVDRACHAYASAHEPAEFYNIAEFIRKEVGDRR